MTNYKFYDKIQFGVFNMSLFKEQVKVLKYIQTDSVKKLDDYLMQQNYKFDLNYLIAGTTPLHEVRSVAMLSYLLHSKVDLRLKNKNKRTALNHLKKKFKELLKKRAQFKKNNASLKDVAKLAAEIKEFSKIIRLLKSVNRRVFKNEIGFDYQGDKDVIFLLSDFKNGVFIEDDRFEKKFKNLSTKLAYYTLTTLNYNKKTEKYLKMGGYLEEKVEQTTSYIKKNLPNLYYLSNNKTPMVFYHGSTNPNFEVSPLMHFGTLKAARERLENMEESYQKKHRNINYLFKITPFYFKMKNPFRIPELANHTLNDYKSLIVHLLLFEKYGFSVIRNLYASYNYQEEFPKKLEKLSVPKEYDFIFKQPYRMPPQAVQNELRVGAIYQIETDETKNIENLVYQRLIRFFERQGYDGFVYKNGWEDCGKDSYICFRKEQLIQATNQDESELKKQYLIDNKRLSKLEDFWLTLSKETVIQKEASKEFPSFALCEFLASPLPYSFRQKILSVKNKIAHRVASLLLHFENQRS